MTYPTFTIDDKFVTKAEEPLVPVVVHMVSPDGAEIMAPVYHMTPTLAREFVKFCEGQHDGQKSSS